MLDAHEFYRQLGATQALGLDEQVLLPGQVRVHCDAQAWTAVFEAMPMEDASLEDLLQAARHWPELVPFSTRSGQPGLRWRSLSQVPQTVESLSCLRAVLRHLVAAT